MVTTYYYAGAVIGKSLNTKQISEIYSKPTVSVEGKKYVGGLIGLYQALETNQNFNVSNVYSRSLVKGDSIVGGLIGQIEPEDKTVINFSNSYSFNQVVGASIVGASVGKIQLVMGTFEIFFTRVFFEQSINGNLSWTGWDSSFFASHTDGLSCYQIYTNIFLEFDPLIWGGDHLISGKKKK